MKNIREASHDRAQQINPLQPKAFDVQVVF